RRWQQRSRRATISPAAVRKSRIASLRTVRLKSPSAGTSWSQAITYQQLRTNTARPPRIGSATRTRSELGNPQRLADHERARQREEQRERVQVGAQQRPRAADHLAADAS